MTDVVVLTEEPSARIVAESLAEKLGLSDRAIFLQHQGKSDLEQSFPRKIGHWRAHTPPRFVVMRDNDRAVCWQLKSRLLSLLPTAATGRVKIRLVVQELESWYLGDLDAVSRAGLLSETSLESHKRSATLRNPEKIGNAKQFFKARIANGGQIALARQIAPHLSLSENRSKSFHAFVSALRWAGDLPEFP